MVLGSIDSGSMVRQNTEITVEVSAHPVTGDRAREGPGTDIPFKGMLLCHTSPTDFPGSKIVTPPRDTKP